jgi:transketolase
MRKQFVNTIESLLAVDERLVLLLGDIGVFGFRNSFAKYPGRVMNVGILEQSTVGVAAGLAKSGLVPVVHTIAPFLVERAYEQIKVDLGYQKLGCNLVSVGGSYDYAALGCTHHCPGDVSALQNIPGLQIVVPGNQSEFDSLFRQSYSNGSPTYYRLSERSNTKYNDVVFGKANLIQAGTKATVIAIGPVLDKVIDAIKDFDVDVLYYSTILPFDQESLVQSLKTKSKILVVEPFYSGTISHLILNALPHRSLMISNIGVPREFLRGYGAAEDHDLAVGLTVENIKKNLKDLINA